MAITTKDRLIGAGLPLLLKHGYSGLSIQAVLDETGLPKGSFYHFFESKETFALEVLDAYMREVHAGLDHCLSDHSLPPLARIRHFFALTQEAYREQGYLGCLIGGLGQELSGTSDTFRRKIDWCFRSIAERMAACLEEARRNKEIPEQSDPAALADRLVECWEGAALRSRLRNDPEPLLAALDFYFKGIGARTG
jgi:TetR/AcrR family transcriptional repressor of nem operon